jgi:hypothetical protein
LLGRVLELGANSAKLAAGNGQQFARLKSYALAQFCPCPSRFPPGTTSDHPSPQRLDLGLKPGR